MTRVVRKPDGVPIRDYVDQRIEDGRQATDVALGAVAGTVAKLDERLDELRLTSAGHLTRPEFDAYAQRQEENRRDLGDELAGFPTKTELRAQLDTVNVTLAAINQKISDAGVQQQISASGLVTKEAFEAFNARQEAQRVASRRGTWAAVGTAVVALVGWLVTIVLSLTGHG